MSEHTYSDDPECPGWAELRTDEIGALAVRHLALWWRGEYRRLRAPALGHEPVSWRHLRFVRAGEGRVAEGRAHLDALLDAALGRDSTWTPCRLVVTGGYRVQPVARAWVDWRDLPRRVRETVETTCFREGRPLPWESASASSLWLAQQECDGHEVIVLDLRDDPAPHDVIPSGIVVCPACGRHQTTDPRTGRPTPHATVMGGSQLCTVAAPTERPS